MARNLKPEDLAPNYVGDWYHLLESAYESNGGHNPLCAIDSKYCSREMSQVDDLCLWHHARMARHQIVRCDCTEHVVCNGDAPGRRMFREYYGSWSMSVIDISGTVYCCGYCQNTDTQTHTCGLMQVTQMTKENPFEMGTF